MDSDHHLLGFHLISAQNLKPPAGLRRMQCYALAYADPSFKVRTSTDHVGGENPTWNDCFVFLVPSSLLHPDSPSAVTIELYAAGGGWRLQDSLVGTVRLLVGNLRLLDRGPGGHPAFAAAGVRRPSGRVHGVLNVGATVLSRTSTLTGEVLSGSPAISYRDLMGGSGRFRLRPTPPPSPAAGRVVLQEINVGNSKRRLGKRDGEKKVGGGTAAAGGQLCGLGFPPRRTHLLCPSPLSPPLASLHSAQ